MSDSEFVLALTAWENTIAQYGLLLGFLLSVILLCAWRRLALARIFAGIAVGAGLPIASIIVDHHWSKIGVVGILALFPLALVILDGVSLNRKLRRANCRVSN